MCKIDVTPGPGITRAQADFVGCLMTALLAALPSFLENLMTCLRGNTPPAPGDAYKPGDRPRC